MAKPSQSGKGQNTVARITELAEPIAQQLHLRLWDVRFEKEGASWYLRFFIDADEGVTLEDCEAFSRVVDPVIDEADPIDQSYYMEVSSPGLCRELKRLAHYEASIGREIAVRLIRPLDGVRDFEGVLENADKTQFTLRTPEGTRVFAYQDCANVKWKEEIEF